MMMGRVRRFSNRGEGGDSVFGDPLPTEVSHSDDLMYVADRANYT